MDALYGDYSGLADEKLPELIRQGDAQAQDYMIDKYKNLVKVKARAYFLIGADREDLMQEGMIGLFKAIRDYKAEKLVSFSSFAELCINRQMITAIKAATRQKHLPLNSYVSLNNAIYDEEADKTFMEILSAQHITNPEELFIGREEKKTIEKQLEKELSALESRVLALYLQGKSYEEIAQIISKDEKSIDNALQRVRRKVLKIIREKER